MPRIIAGALTSHFVFIQEIVRADVRIVYGTCVYLFIVQYLNGCCSSRESLF